MNEKNVTIERLCLAYEDCCRRKRSTQDYKIFSINAAENLYSLYVDLNKETYEISESIAFMVHYPKDREVFAATFRDRVVQHLLTISILDNFEQEVIYDSYSCRIGKGTTFGIKRCIEQIIECSNNYTEKTYIAKCDLKSFFMSINKTLLYGYIEKFLEKYHSDNDDLHFLKYITKKIVFDTPQKHCKIKCSKQEWRNLPKDKSLFNLDDNHGLPIGNITSQIFANLFLDLLDKYFKNKLGIKYYGRYVDDFFLIHNNKEVLLQAIKKIEMFLCGIEITLHPKKIIITNVERGFEFLGVIIKPRRIYVKSKTKGHFYETLTRISKYFHEHENIVTNTDIDYLLTSVNSTLGYLKRFNTYNLRKKITNGKIFSCLYHYFDINVTRSKIIKKPPKYNRWFLFYSLFSATRTLGRPSFIIDSLPT